MTMIYPDDKKNEKVKIYIMIAITVVVVIAAIVIAVLVFRPKKKNQNAQVETTTQEQTTQMQTMQTVASTTTAAETKTQQMTTQPTVTSAPLFMDIDDSVTAKEVTNLRDSYYDNANIVGSISYGEYIERTGYNDNGWSRLIFNGETVYAKTQLLLKEGEKPATVASWTDEYNMTYQDVDEQVTAKEETNLRTVPSTDSNDTIYVTIKKGTYVNRIGIGDKGWSKISYDGKILYAVSNYLSKE